MLIFGRGPATVDVALVDAGGLIIRNHLPSGRMSHKESGKEGNLEESGNLDTWGIWTPIVWKNLEKNLDTHRFAKFRLFFPSVIALLPASRFLFVRQNGK